MGLHTNVTYDYSFIAALVIPGLVTSGEGKKPVAKLPVVKDLSGKLVVHRQLQNSYAFQHLASRHRYTHRAFVLFSFVLSDQNL